MKKFSVLPYITRKSEFYILDIGCSDCSEGEELIENGIFLTGIDQDEETITKAKERLPQASFFVMNAADFRISSDKDDECNKIDGFDMVLLRRPDLILGSYNWRRIFKLFHKWLKYDGIVLITTPGKTEARLAQKWLKEDGKKEVSYEMKDYEDEKYIIVAKNLQEDDKSLSEINTASEDKKHTSSLVKDLLWKEDNTNTMVCDVKTGKCTF